MIAAAGLRSERSLLLQLPVAPFAHWQTALAWRDLVFEPKREYHVTLTANPPLTLPPDTELNRLAASCQVRLQGPLRRLYDVEQDRQSIIALCAINGLDRLTAALATRGIHCSPLRPWHVTLWTLNDAKGINVDTPERLASLSVETIDMDAIRGCLAGPSVAARSA